jgi:hypothetical protein
VTTPRIDTLRRRLANATTQLGHAARILEALHDLAYTNTNTNTTEHLGVTTSAPEGYTLLHGSPHARSAYKALAHELDAALGQITGACNQALNAVAEGDTSNSDRRIPVTIDAVEHLAAIDAQLRRTQRGEFNPGATITQPTRPNADRSAAGRIQKLELELAKRTREENREIARLETQVRRLTERIARQHQTIAQLTELPVGHSPTPSRPTDTTEPLQSQGSADHPTAT